MNPEDVKAIIERYLKDTAALSAFAQNFKITQNTTEAPLPVVNIRGDGSVDFNTFT